MIQKNFRYSARRLKSSCIHFLLFTICSFVLFFFIGFTVPHEHVKQRSSLEISKPTIALENAVSRHMHLNSSCILVGCHSRATVGVEYFWDYYSKQGVSISLIAFDQVVFNKKSIHPTWCRIPAVYGELMKHPNAKVVYIDIDTLCDVNIWCNMPHLGEHAPIVMNSLHRSKQEPTKDFIVHGTRVQANLFVVAPGEAGRRAIKRWEDSFGEHSLRDQGSIHKEEGSLCGVPGWVYCHSNPQQQKCHCAGHFKGNSSAKSYCIKRLFSGEINACSIVPTMLNKASFS